MTQQLRLQPKVGAEAIQCKSCADQFLIRGRDPGDAPVQISQQLAALIENADAPHPLFRPHGSFQGRLQGWAKRTAAEQGLALALNHWWRRQQWRRCPKGQLRCQHQQSEQCGTNHKGVTPLTTPFKR